MEPEFEQTVIFSCRFFFLEILCPFKAKSFDWQILSSGEEAWERDQRSYSSIYCNKAEPLENFVSPKSPFKVCEKEGALNKIRHYCRDMFSFPSEDKRT